MSERTIEQVLLEAKAARSCQIPNCTVHGDVVLLADEITAAFTRGYEKARDDAAKVGVDYQRIWRNNIVAAEQIESAIRALSAEGKEQK